MNNIGIRPQPRGRYQLLLEHTGSPAKVKRALVVGVLITAIIGAASIAAFLAWESLSAVQDTAFLLQMIKLSNNRSLSTETLQHRKQLYEIAIEDRLMWSPPKAEAQIPFIGSSTLKLVCYFDLPASAKDLQPEIIDNSLCTHIIVAFAKVENDKLTANNPEDEALIERVVKLKDGNHVLKVMISVGGGGVSTKGFSDMVSSRSSRKSFITSALAFISKFGLDGLDFDWEFPDWPKNKLERPRFTQLLSELRTEIEQQGLSVLMSVAVAAPQPIVDHSYDISSMARNIDFVNIMSYDYHFYARYLPVTGINAPLYARANEEGYLHTLNANYTTSYWSTRGMPLDKIVLGLPTYGHSFTLVNPGNNAVAAPASGNGILGTGGFISYADACWFISEGQAKEVFDLETKSPYAFRGKEWISFDDERSLSYKAQYVIDSHLGGAMIFSLNMDDFNGLCSNGKVRFPLTRQVSNVLQDDQL